MHQNPILALDYYFGIQTKFSQGGVNHYDSDQYLGKLFKSGLNFIGW